MAHKLDVQQLSSPTVFWTFILLTEQKKIVQGRDYTVEKQLIQRKGVGSELRSEQLNSSNYLPLMS